MLNENKIVRGLWVGTEQLTAIQKLSIKSFLDNGHEFHLYTYRQKEGIPSGTTVIDAESIIPWSDRKKFANDVHLCDWFRSNVMWNLGGWFVDTDVVCLQPFDFDQPRVFVGEYQFGQGPPALTKPLVNGCIVKIPAKDEMTGAILDRVRRMDTLHCDWIDVGPAQFRWGVNQFDYRDSIQHPDVFDSLWPDSLHNFVYAEGMHPWIQPEKAKAIHLRASYWKSGTRLDPDGEYPLDSCFERLKVKHGVVNDV